MAPFPAPLPETWLSFAQLAKYAGIHLSTVYRLKDAGKLPWFKIGGRRVVDRIAFDRKVRKGEM